MRLPALVAAAELLAITYATAQETPKKPWSDSAELGFAMTTGNSQGSNFNVSNKFKYTWSHAELTCDLSALRAESPTRTITNPPPYGTPVVTDIWAVTAESYLVSVKYRRNFSERFYWFVGAGWYRNVFAGIDGREGVLGGVGYTVLKSPRHVLKGELGFDLTHENQTSAEPTDYIAARGTVSYEFKISEKSKLTEDLSAVENLDTTNDWRVNSVTALTAGLNSWLALKLSYTVLYAHQPPIQTVPAVPGPGPDAFYPFESTDTILTTTLVINF